MTVTALAPALLPFGLRVMGAHQLSRSFLRLALGGDSLAGFRDPGPGLQDLRVKLVVPTPGPAPSSADLAPGWYQRWRAQDPATRGTVRTYTVRNARLHGPCPEIDVDVVLHDDGLASSWARRARLGDPITVIGPSAAAPGYGGTEWHPPRASVGSPVQVLLVGDETAVPAIGSILATLPPGYDGHAILEVAHRDDFLDLPTHSGVEVCWLARGGHPRGRLAQRAVRDVMRARAGRFGAGSAVLPLVDVDTDKLWERSAADGCPGDFYAWVAGEAGMVVAIRRHLVHEVGVDRHAVAFMGYWRAGRSENG